MQGRRLEIVNEEELMIEQPNAQKQTPQPQKLILPAYSDEQQYRNTGRQSPVKPVGPWLAPTPDSTTPSFSNPFLKLGYFWRKDAAHKVLLLAVAAIIISGVLFMALGSASLLQGPVFTTQNATAPQNPSAEVHPSGTIDLHPTFPTPSGGTGSTTSSQPPPFSSFYPTPDTTSILQPTGTGALTVQITSIPSQVSNHSRVFVDVATSEGGVAVRLQVYYDAQPFSYTTGLRTTDDNGNASIPWRVQVNASGSSQVTATVAAVAIDQNGQQGVSQAMQVVVLV
jgi:hypothetical protein